MIKKHCLEKVSASRFRNSGKPYKPNGNKVFQNAKTQRGNPCKTLFKLIILEPFSENGLQNHQKALPREGFRIAFSPSQETL